MSRPEDLVRLACLTFPYPSFRSSWWFTRGSKSIEIALQPCARISNAVALSEAVSAGLGIALLPDWLVDESIAQGKLIQLLPGWNASGVAGNHKAALWTVMPSRQFVPKKTAVFSAFLKTLI